jgi:hypothetical protein
LQNKQIESKSCSKSLLLHKNKKIFKKREENQGRKRRNKNKRRRQKIKIKCGKKKF